MLPGPLLIGLEAGMKVIVVIKKCGKGRAGPLLLFVALKSIK